VGLEWSCLQEQPWKPEMRTEGLSIGPGSQWHAERGGGAQEWRKESEEGDREG